MRLIPPVAISVGAGDVAASVFASRDERSEAFREALAVATRSSIRSGTRVELFGSGRAALAAVLAAARAPNRDEVVVPAYTCWSVAAAAVRAGLRVRLVDVDPRSLDIDPASLERAASDRVACVVLAHLFARSSDVTTHAASAAARMPQGTWVVEDAAQAWPGAGSDSADAVVLSFGRGKPVALGGGGALLHRAGEASMGGPAPRGGGWAAAGSLALAAALAKPRWYRIPESLPFLGIGDTVYDPDFPTRRPFREWQAALGIRSVDDLPRLARLRTRNATAIIEKIETLRGWSLPAPARGEGPIRLPVLAPTRERRESMLRALRRRGVAASPMYPGTLADIPELAPHVANLGAALAGAAEIAARLLTLPVYPTLTSREAAEVAVAFERAAAEAGP